MTRTKLAVAAVALAASTALVEAQWDSYQWKNMPRKAEPQRSPLRVGAL